MLAAMIAAALLCVPALVLLRWFHARSESRANAIPVPTFIGSVTTAWALALGFAAADIWTVNAHAERVTSQERSAISRLAGMASASALDSPELMEALRGYKVAIIQHEWQENANSVQAAEVDGAIQQIRLHIVRLAIAGVPEALVAKMTADFDELQDARNERIAIGAGSVSEYKWYLVLFLSFLSLVTIAAIHADKPLAGRNAIFIFTIVSVVSMWILAIHANPYLGVARIMPEEVEYPLDRVLLQTPRADPSAG